MNAASGLPARLLSVIGRLPRLGLAQPLMRTRRSARGAVVWFAIGTFAISGATLLASDVFATSIRDPEYGWRAASLRDRVAENPNRRLVLFVGSSRVAGAIAPVAWEANHTDPAEPFLFNMGRAGSGPILQLMTLRRTYADGFRPSLVLLEYWPPMLCQTKVENDFRRITPDQMLLSDLPLVREYADDSGEFERAMWRNRMNPIWGLRQTYMQQIALDWVPWAKRTDGLYTYLDPWGWSRGPSVPMDGHEARTRKFVAWAVTLFREQFKSFEITPDADRALRESVALARANGAKVGFVFLPESSEFRSWYPANVERLVGDHQRAMREELNIPMINACTWLEDGYFADGFHVTELGGLVFSHKLKSAVKAVFPEVWNEPENQKSGVKR
jgi:hypothetical protein